MSLSIFTVFSELASECEGSEQEFSIAHINSAIAHLESTIKTLEDAKRTYRNGTIPDFVTCDRLQRLSKRAQNILNMAQGREITLPRF